MKRILIHALLIFAFANAYTKGTIVGALLFFIPTYALILITVLFLIFLAFLAFITRYENDAENAPSWKSIIKVAVLGTAAGYVLQLINIAVYLKIRNLSIEIGPFEDEFYRSVVYLFPLLLLGEVVYKLVRNDKVKRIAFVMIVLIPCAFQFAKVLIPEKKQKYPDVKKASPEKPNIIIILADDLGVGDLSYNGQTNYRTPNIDKLANEGVNFKNGFCTAGVCSPSRAGLLTGEYQQRYGFEFLADGFSTHPYTRRADFENEGYHFGGTNKYWWEVEITNRGIDPQTITIAEFLKEDGYATGLVGKWHLGVLPKFRPSNHGFDYAIGTYSAGMYYLSPGDDRIVDNYHPGNFHDKLERQLQVYQIWENDLPRRTKNEELTTDLFTNKGIEFIEKNKDNRFFLYLPYTAVHAPLQAPKRIFDTLSHIKDFDKRVYTSMVISLDEAVGKVMKKLEELDLDENTIVVFSSDNGAPLYIPAGSNLPLYGGKMSSFEGGLHVPFIMYWKNHLKPTNYNHNVSLMDVFKTVAGAIGKEVPKNVAVDGVNLLPFITKDTSLTPHPSLYWRVGYAKAIRKDNWKLNINEKEGFEYLHNLNDDPYETKNIAESNPKLVNELKAELAAWEKQLKKSNWSYSLDEKIEDGRGNKFYFPW
jgi:arylsulfatase A-like enzyme